MTTFLSPAASSPLHDTAPGFSTGPAEPELWKTLTRQMLLIRRFEEKAGQLYGLGLIGGFCHLYIGEEAVVVGVLSALCATDSVVTSYRDHGHLLACGLPPATVMAELTGRRDGCAGGKGGSMHMFSLDKRFYGGHGIVAAQVPIGTGLAFAHSYRGDGGLAATFLGDGAINQGQVYESFNMAALWHLPVLYVIENNGYAMGTSQARAAAGELHQRGMAYGIPGRPVNGMDVLAVREATLDAVAAIRAGSGPMILEMKTYRYRGHSMSDPAKYRSREEVERMRQDADPIDQMQRRLLEAGILDEAALKRMDQELKAEVATAAQFAQESPEPDPAALTTHILAPSPA